MHVARSIAILALFIGTANVYASANLAKIPVAIRQIYNDGTSTELNCKNHNSCTFTLHEKHAQRLSLEPKYFGYSILDAISNYSYWSNSGHDLVLAFDVSCQKADLELVDDPDPECRMFLKRKGNGFIAERIDVWPKNGHPESRYPGIAP